MPSPLDHAALDQLFLSARTHNAWSAREVPESLLGQIVEIMKLGPTSANCSPARIVFVTSPAAKGRLVPLVSEGNAEKVQGAPVTAIIGYDLAFYEHLPRLFPHTDAKAWFEGKPDHIARTAFRNGTLQGAYLMLAARAIGLDCGPMSGFDNDAVDREFFAGTRIQSNFLCNLGYGDPSGLFPRGPRLSFDEIATIV